MNYKLKDEKKDEKEGKEREGSEQAKEKKPVLRQGVIKSIVGVILIVLELVIILSFLGRAGIAGTYLDLFLGKLFGWGRYLLPLVIAGGGLLYFHRLRIFQYYLSSFGIALSFFFLLILFHSFTELRIMESLARQGKGGGYLGYGGAYLVIKYLGRTAGIIVSLGAFLVGLMLTFNFSLEKPFAFYQKGMEKIKDLWERWKWRQALKEDDNNNEESGLKEEKEGAEEEVEEINEITREKENVQVKIKAIEFNNGEVERIAEEEKEQPSLSKRNSFFKKRLEGKAATKFVGDFGENEGNEAMNASLRPTRSVRSKWCCPPLALFEKNGVKSRPKNLEKNTEIIKKTLHDFGIEVESSGYNIGPTVIQYTFKPAVGVKVSQIINLQNDLALALEAHPIRIEAPIPGKSLVGIEVPISPSNRSLVRMRAMLASKAFREARKFSKMIIPLGEDVNGEVVLGNISKMPHMMIAGSTGAGKSVCVNAILLSLLYQNSPQDLKLILIDPKRVELSLYNNIPHLLTPVITDIGKVINALKWAIAEMGERLKLLEEVGVRDIASFNEKVSRGKKRQVFNEEIGKYEYEDLERLPFIIIVIDELADVMMAYGKEVEAMIARLTQMARAVGIHLIISTQRPSVEIITGLIKNNIPVRIAFKVPTQIDSRTILDMAGAEKLLGNGDMLYRGQETTKPKRIQGVFVPEKEVKRIVKFVKEQAETRKLQQENSRDQEMAQSLEESLDNSGTIISGDRTNSARSEKEQQLFEEAKRLIIETGKASTTFLQRRLGVGYPRAANIMDALEQAGIVSQQEGSKPRKVLITTNQPEAANMASEETSPNTSPENEELGDLRE